MKAITFIDIEVEPKSGRILDIGGVKASGNLFHSSSIVDFASFVRGSEYICGHNLFNHDLKYISSIFNNNNFINLRFIDTLHLSPLLFPAKPYHALLKDDKLQSDDVNNPLNDSIKAKDLFFDEVTAFRQISSALGKIYYNLLIDAKEFDSFFHYLDYNENSANIEIEIREKFNSRICENADLSAMVSKNPVELAYCLALINTNNRYSITPPWVLKTHPNVYRIMHFLRNKACLTGCKYCKDSFDIYRGLKRFFGFDSYRTFAGKPLQEKAVKAAVVNKSILAIFPTGGGKSIAFQLPALMSGVNMKGLTVVISPLQSLMKDQVDNLELAGITEAVTINGLLDPIERAKSFERVENGSASILYISPESLRSRSIERLMLGRKIVRFVIDEAHCFSAWGQDFRVDYMYIADFIKSIDKKIPVSCFTATAKIKVIEDILKYFKDRLNIDMEVFSSEAARENLHYKVIEEQDEEEKYNTMRSIIETKNCPTIVYVSRTKKAYMLASRLAMDGFSAVPYHGKMNKQEKTKNQDSFMRGEVQTIVATSAFGMGVDKKDVGMVIHYEISDSLESYIQEAGRAGRDESITADCYVLYNDDDLSKHFILLNQTKISIQEIQQIWKALKELTRFRAKVSQSALEIARKAGWDDSISDIETRVTTAIAALEEAGYLKRGQNMPRIYADSILSENVQEAFNKIDQSNRFDEKQNVQAKRIIKKLLSSKSRMHATDEEAESRIDYISDHLGIDKRDVIEIVNLLREEKVLADAKDLSAFIRRGEKENHSLEILTTYLSIERFLLELLRYKEVIIINEKEVIEKIEQIGCNGVTRSKITTILNYWAIKNLIKKQKQQHTPNHIALFGLYENKTFEQMLIKRYELAKFIVEFLYEKSNNCAATEENKLDNVLVEFSVLELKREFESRLTFFRKEVDFAEIEDALYFLSKINALIIEGGFMIVYNPLTVERKEMDNRKRYKEEDYRKLEQFYANKVMQIHIVGEYAKKMIENYLEALKFVDDYFRLNFTVFLKKYFKDERLNEIKRSLTPAKFRKLFGDLSTTQLKIINDNKSKYIVVAAGPGSGKTRILVHKLASLLLMEDVKHEQLLMLTFSRAAVTEFKARLIKLIGSSANYIEIKTFHSYCFDVLGRVGSIGKSGEIIQETVMRIKNGEVEPGRITKTVLVIDEAQDIDSNEYELITALMQHNEEMRIIAVGDDDQSIFEFRGASSKYLGMFVSDMNASMYELVENYRSKANLVDFANHFVRKISKRLKESPIIPIQKCNGDIKLFRYKNGNLIIPLVNNMLSQALSGSTCVLTATNDEALQITGVLAKNGQRAKLIQSNDHFNLQNLLEINFFMNQLRLEEGIRKISEEAWESAKRRVRERFSKSENLEVCENIIRDFERTNLSHKYKTDLEIFISESKLEDFLTQESGTIFVSTMHKAKGREFDNIYLMLERFNGVNEETLRLIYVAITRAKNNLYIHSNGDVFDFIATEGFEIIKDSRIYQEPDRLNLQTTFKDVWLDSFKYSQQRLLLLNAGDELTVDGHSCLDSNGYTVLKFSKLMAEKIDNLKQKNFIAKSAKVRFIIYWKKEGLGNEILILLPELCFERYHNV